MFQFQAEIKAIFVDKFERLMNVVSVASELEHLKLIIHFNELTQDQLNALREHNLGSVELISFNELLVSSAFYLF